MAADKSLRILLALILAALVVIAGVLFQGEIRPLAPLPGAGNDGSFSTSAGDQAHGSASPVTAANPIGDSTSATARGTGNQGANSALSASLEISQRHDPQSPAAAGDSSTTGYSHAVSGTPGAVDISLLQSHLALPTGGDIQVPVAFVNPLPEDNFSSAQNAALGGMRQQFIDGMQSGPALDPGSPAYANRWQQLQLEYDQQYLAQFGFTAFNKYVSMVNQLNLDSGAGQSTPGY